MPKIYTDSIHKIAYATDASAYREIPKGVSFPQNTEDIKVLLQYAKDKGTFVIPRAAGTSIAGQVVGIGIVTDISRYWNHILEINAEERWAWVEPGVVRDELNIALRPYGLFFSPETSTSDRCCIGGMFGNNSCGTHSLVYGSTRDHILEARGILADGSEEHFKEYSIPELESRFGCRFWEKSQSQSLIESIYAQLICLHRDKLDTIVNNFPDRSLKRRSCGYSIDETIETLPDSINLCKLLAGSEGTLAFITAIKVSLNPVPAKEKMVLCAHCNTLEGCFEANLIALRHGPVAIELMDRKVLELSKSNPEWLKGMPEGLLIAEFNGPGMDAKADALESELMDGYAYACTRVYGSEVAKVWGLRKAGLGVLTKMPGDAKPVGVIEDTAVAAERLPAYIADFRKMLEELGLDCVFYGHISTGELHLRPILNLKDEHDRVLFRQVAERTAALVKKHRGSLSGEHGDGRLRGEFLTLMYGEEVYEMMRSIKHCWDPDGIFNMGKIVDTPPMDEWLRYDAGQTYRVDAPKLMWSIEQCNGAAVCRRSNVIGGTMCPAFKVSGLETMSTRARANILRECLTRGEGLDSPEVKEVLDSCLACKGCKSDCPSDVDMTAIRAQVLDMMHKEHGTPLRSWLVARMPVVESLGHLVRPIYNALASWDLSSRIIKSVVRFASERDIPALSRRSMRTLVRKMGSKGGRRVYLFADEFTNWQEAELGLHFAQLLDKLGYEMVIPKHVESGRASISKGCLGRASRLAMRNVSLLKDIISEETPLVGIEPSCILSFRDEYPDLVSSEMKDDAMRLGKDCLLFDEFLVREIEAGRISPESFVKEGREIWLHGHCHQKALVGVQKTADMLGKLLETKVNVIPSGCCGMAGSFGYEKEHYETSMAIGEMVLFPAVRKAEGSIVAAPGTSCRHHIKDGTGIEALHPIEILYRHLR